MYPPPLPPIIVDPTQEPYIDHDEQGFAQEVVDTMSAGERFGGNIPRDGSVPTMETTVGGIMSAAQSFNVAAGIPLDSAQEATAFQDENVTSTMIIPPGLLAGLSGGLSL